MILYLQRKLIVMGTRTTLLTPQKNNIHFIHDSLFTPHECASAIRSLQIPKASWRKGILLVHQLTDKGALILIPLFNDIVTLTTSLTMSWHKRRLTRDGLTLLGPLGRASGWITPRGLFSIMVPPGWVLMERRREIRNVSIGVQKHSQLYPIHPLSGKVPYLKNRPEIKNARYSELFWRFRRFSNRSYHFLEQNFLFNDFKHVSRVPWWFC